MPCPWMVTVIRRIRTEKILAILTPESSSDYSRASWNFRVARHSSCVPCPFLFHLGHAQAVADQSATVAAVGPAKLRRSREPGAQGHRTIPALEPVIRTTHDLVSDGAGAEKPTPVDPDMHQPSHPKLDNRSFLDGQGRRCALARVRRPFTGLRRQVIVGKGIMFP